MYNQNMRKETIEKMKEFEKEGKFNEHLYPNSSENIIEIDDNYKYINKNIFFVLGSVLVRLFMFIFGPLIANFYYGLKVEGRKNLKKIGGGFLVSNHVLIMDNLLIRQATFKIKKPYYVVGMQNNCKKHIGGLFLRLAGFLPVGSTISAQKNFKNSLNEIVKRNCLVHFYPEQSLWPHYEKSRPFKRGAFFYASETNAPVIPVIVLFRSPKGILKWFYKHKLVTIKICEPIFPKAEFLKREQSEMLMIDTQKVYNEVIEDYYGK